MENTRLETPLQPPETLFFVMERKVDYLHLCKSLPLLIELKNPNF